MSAVLVLAHRQPVAAARVQVRAHPIQVCVGATTIACDEATARAIHTALSALLAGDDSRYTEPGGLPLPGGVDGFVPHGPVELPAPGAEPDRDWGDPSYRTDNPRRRP